VRSVSTLFRRASGLALCVLVLALTAAPAFAQGNGNGGGGNGNGGNGNKGNNNGNGNGGNGGPTINLAATPELSSLMLVGAGLTGLGGYAVMRLRAARRPGDEEIS
jgi:hypothetical protein